MVRQPIDEISCCNCVQCQAYILKLVQRIEALENIVKELKTVYSWERSRYIVVTEEPIEKWVEVQNEIDWEEYANHQYDGVPGIDPNAEEET